MAANKDRKYEKTVTVACVNYPGVWGDKAANLKKMKSLVMEAAGANIIAFPELALSGYECSEDARRERKPCALHRAAADTIPGATTGEMAALAKKLDVYIIFGMPERDAADPEVYYNSAAVVGPESITGRYRKVHLAGLPVWTENLCFKPGDEVPVFETRYGLIGVQICFDFWRVPELSRIQYLKGARIIFNLAASSSKEEFMTLASGGRAIECQSFTASSNMVGREKSFGYCGGSVIAGPSYPEMVKIYAQGGESEGIVMATLDFESLEHWENLLDLRKGTNWKLIAREYRRLSE